MDSFPLGAASPDPAPSGLAQLGAALLGSGLFWTLAVAAGILLFLLFLASRLRFRFALFLDYPRRLDFMAQGRFFGWRKSLKREKHSLGSSQEPLAARAPSLPEPAAWASLFQPGASAFREGWSSSQAGFVQVPSFADRLDSPRPGPGPDSGPSGPGRARESRSRRRRGHFKRKLRAALYRFLSRPETLRLLLGYLVRAGRAVMRLLHLKVEVRRAVLALREETLLGGIAAVKSALSGPYPFFAFPLHYRFEEGPSRLRLRLRGEFSALGILSTLVRLIVIFPWSRAFGLYRLSYHDKKMGPLHAFLHRKLKTAAAS